MHHQRTAPAGELLPGIHAPTPIAPSDIPMVHSLIARCYEEYGLRLCLDDECEQHLQEPGSYFRAGGGDFWVVHDETGVVRATVALHVHPAVAGSDATAGELKSMYVDHSWRRRGVGRALTLHVLAAARAAGCSVMELWSDTRFEPAHRMYESLGFIRHGVRDIIDSNNSREFGYRLEL